MGHVSFLCVTVVLSCNIARSAFCFEQDGADSIASLYVSMAAYIGLLLCRLGTLLFRLYNTFKDSYLRMTDRLKLTFLIIFVTMAVLCLVSYCIGPFVTKWYQDWSMFIIALILYFVLSTWACALFARNLLRLAQSRAKSTLNVLNVASNSMEITH